LIIKLNQIEKMKILRVEDNATKSKMHYKDKLRNMILTKNEEFIDLIIILNNNLIR